MDFHLRLAERRGSLTHPNSRVQDLALRMLLLREDRMQGNRRSEALRLALLNTQADPQRLHSLFPEYFPVEWLERQAFEAAKDESGEINIDLLDDSAVTWGVPSPEEDAEMARWIAERESGSVTAADLAGNDGWV